MFSNTYSRWKKYSVCLVIRIAGENIQCTFSNTYSRWKKYSVRLVIRIAGGTKYSVGLVIRIAGGRNTVYV